VVGIDDVVAGLEGALGDFDLEAGLYRLVDYLLC
jgi:hypothetical protein